MQRLSADAEQSSDFTNSPMTPQFGHHIFGEDDAGMNRFAAGNLILVD
jgi:hypothetical protein